MLTIIWEINGSLLSSLVHQYWSLFVYFSLYLTVVKLNSEKNIFQLWSWNYERRELISLLKRLSAICKLCWLLFFRHRYDWLRHPLSVFFWNNSVYSYSGSGRTELTEYQFPNSERNSTYCHKPKSFEIMQFLLFCRVNCISFTRQTRVELLFCSFRKQSRSQKSMNTVYFVYSYSAWFNNILISLYCK